MKLEGKDESIKELFNDLKSGHIDKRDKSRWDVFICYASEDEELVEPLATCLRELGLDVWYDDFEIKIGDSLARSIDKGLINSDKGIIIISKDFINKSHGTPGHELSGLISRKLEEKTDLILPIWHGVNKKDVLNFSPTLVDIRAIKTDYMDINQICLKIVEVVRPDIYEHIHRVVYYNNLIKNTKPEMVNVKDLKSGPIRYQNLPKKLTLRINFIYHTLSDVINMSKKEFSDGFKHDVNPSDEIIFWEGIALLYSLATKNRDLTIQKKTELYHLFLEGSMGLDITKFNFKYLTKEDLDNLQDDLNQ